MNDSCFIRALYRQSVPHTPVWLMRQAGRYLPEYRALREKTGDFLTACKTPDIACEITLQPLRRFSLDAAIIFSDILTIPDAMGLGLYFAKDHGPCFQHALTSEKAIQQLPIPDPEDELGYVMQAVRQTKQALPKNFPLIGFAGSPWTLAAYMIEGGSSHAQFPQARAMIYRHPTLMHSLLEKLTQATIAYLNAQIAAGADAIMIFDTWGGLLTTTNYQIFSLFYIQKIIAQLTKIHNNQNIPSIVFTKHGGQWLEAIAASGCNAVGLDWTTDLAQARQRIGHRVAVQGNLDPAILYATPSAIRTEIQHILTQWGTAPGHIFNLGHGIPKDVPVENVAAVIAAVHELSAKP